MLKMDRNGWTLTPLACQCHLCFSHAHPAELVAGVPILDPHCRSAHEGSVVLDVSTAAAASGWWTSQVGAPEFTIRNATKARISNTYEIRSLAYITIQSQIAAKKTDTFQHHHQMTSFWSSSLLGSGHGWKLPKSLAHQAVQHDLVGGWAYSCEKY